MHVYMQGLVRGDFSIQAGTLQNIYKRGRRQEWKIRVMALKEEVFWWWILMKLHRTSQQRRFRLM